MDKRIHQSVLAKTPDYNPINSVPTKARWTLYWFMGLATAWFYVIGQTTGTVSFIYFGY
jgi:hypothetical protein